jgi:hypothetical protein
LLHLSVLQGRKGLLLAFKKGLNRLYFSFLVMVLLIQYLKRENGQHLISIQILRRHFLEARCIYAQCESVFNRGRIAMPRKVHIVRRPTWTSVNSRLSGGEIHRHCEQPTSSPPVGGHALVPAHGTTPFQSVGPERL